MVITAFRGKLAITRASVDCDYHVFLEDDVNDVRRGTPCGKGRKVGMVEMNILSAIQIITKGSKGSTQCGNEMD